MLCKNPFSQGMHLFPCGQCMPCRFNRRRTWTHRILLESMQHSDNAFVTLTYNAERLPRIYMNTGSELGTLVPRDAQNFLKRLRKRIAPMRVRFYLVGEYGEKEWRPHYHAAIFGLPSCVRGHTLRFRGRPIADRCCSQCRMVSDVWERGDVDLGTVETDSAQYLAGYTTKKMTRYDDPRLLGRHPEFARMSLRPGIGYHALWEIADVLMSLDLDVSEADVPSALRHGKRIWPLGRYLRSRLRLMIGKEATCPDEVLQEVASKLLPLRLAARASSENPSFKAQVVEAFAQDVLNLETRNKIFRKRSDL